MVTTLQSRLNRVMQTMGWNQAQLADEIGVSRQTVSRWMADGKRGMEARHGFALADKTGFDPRWILTGDGRPDDVPPDLRAEHARHLRAVARILDEHVGR